MNLSSASSLLFGFLSGCHRIACFLFSLRTTNGMTHEKESWKREREREGGRGKVWEWSRSGRCEDEDANRAADPRGREGRVGSGLPQQQQQQKKKKGRVVVLGNPRSLTCTPFGSPSRWPPSSPQERRTAPRPSWRTPLPHSHSLALALAARVAPNSLSSFRVRFPQPDLEFEDQHAATAFVWLAA